MNASPTGSISGRVTIPTYLYHWTYTVAAAGGCTLESVSGANLNSEVARYGWAKITITTRPTAKAVLSSTSGPAGKRIELRINGFPTGDTVDIYYPTGKKYLGDARATTNGTGRASYSVREYSSEHNSYLMRFVHWGIDIPSRAPIGNYQMILRSQNYGIAIKVTYRVTSTAAQQFVIRDEFAWDSSTWPHSIG